MNGEQGKSHFVKHSWRRITQVNEKTKDLDFVQLNLNRGDSNEIIRLVVSSRHRTTMPIMSPHQHAKTCRPPEANAGMPALRMVATPKCDCTTVEVEDTKANFEPWRT